MKKLITISLLALALLSGCGGDQNVTVSGGGASSTSTSGTDNSQTTESEPSK